MRDASEEYLNWSEGILTSFTDEKECNGSGTQESEYQEFVKHGGDKA